MEKIKGVYLSDFGGRTGNRESYREYTLQGIIACVGEMSMAERL